MCEDESKLLSTTAAAKFLEVSSSSIKRWIDSGKLEARKTAGGHRRIPMYALRDFRANFYEGSEAQGSGDGVDLASLDLDEMIQRINQWLVNGDQESVVNAFVPLVDNQKVEFIDKVFIPVYSLIRRACLLEDPNCNVHKRSLEIIKKALLLGAGTQSKAQTKQRIVFADVGDPMDCLPTYAAELCVGDRMERVQLGDATPQYVLKKAIDNLQPRYIFLHGKGGEARTAASEVQSYISSKGLSTQIISVAACDCSDFAHENIQRFGDLSALIERPFTL